VLIQVGQRPNFDDPWLTFLARLPIALVLSTIAAALSYRIVEQPWLERRARRRKPPIPRAEPAAAAAEAR
jgi:peptidoglycan/LPS O-acetylase OafA/YrhL